MPRARREAKTPVLGLSGDGAERGGQLGYEFPGAAHGQLVLAVHASIDAEFAHDTVRVGDEVLVHEDRLGSAEIDRCRR